MLPVSPIRQSGGGGDMVQRQRDAAVQRSVLTMQGVADRRRRLLAKSHQAVAVGVIEGDRRGGSQYRRNTAEGDDLGVVW